MTRKMLINGRYADELRMAVVEEGVLQSYRVEVAEAEALRGNIYRGTVANIEESLDAAFVDYGVEKHGFLTRHDVVEQAYHRRRGGEGSRITDLLQKGRPILVQVEKDAIGTKGAALTTNVSFAGRYLVLQPFETTIGLSRKVEDEQTRKKLKEKVKGLVAGEGFGFIVRTNAVDQTKIALKADLDELVRRWKGVQESFEAGTGPALLHDDQDLIVQALRDHLDASIDEVLVDDEALFARARAYMDAVMPKSKTALTHYAERIPLFSRFNLEPQVAAIYKRSVPLPSGGSIVIDPTEALTAIDVNSGKSTSAGSQEETALATNLEAAVEVARQLRLRDLGGLVVVDFIDLRTPKRRRELEKAMKEAMKADKARSHVGHLSPNGLLELNRQRIGRALQLRTHRSCPTCGGTGRLQAPELLGLSLLRRIEAGAATGRMRRARVALHPQTAEAIQNKLRRQLAAVESTFKIAIELVAASDLSPSEDRIQWTEREPAPDGAVGTTAERPREEGAGRAEREERRTRERPREREAGRARSQERRARPEEEGSRRKGRKRRERGKERPREERSEATVAEEVATVAAAAAAPEPVREAEAAELPAPAERPTAPERDEAPLEGEDGLPLEGDAGEPREPGAGEGRSRRRRRRRRGRPPGERPPGAEGERPAAGASEAGEQAARPEPAAVASPADPAQRRRRRRGGRRRRGRGEGPEPAAD